MPRLVELQVPYESQSDLIISIAIDERDSAGVVARNLVVNHGVPEHLQEDIADAIRRLQLQWAQVRSLRNRIITCIRDILTTRSGVIWKWMRFCEVLTIRKMCKSG